MGTFCRLWEYFADYGNILQILGHRGGATLLGLDSMWLSCSALVLFIIIIIIIIIVILISNCAHHGHLYCFTCSSQTIITMQGCVDQRSTCDQQHSGRRAKKRKSLELHKLSKFTTKSQIEPRLCCVFPHLGLGDPHWVSPISGKGSSQEILGFLGQRSHIGGGVVRRPRLHRFRFRLST